MDPADVTHIAIRRDFRSPDTMLGKFGRGNGKALTNSSAPGAFHLEVLRIKVSCRQVTDWSPCLWDRPRPCPAT